MTHQEIIEAQRLEIDTLKDQLRKSEAYIKELQTECRDLAEQRDSTQKPLFERIHKAEESCKGWLSPDEAAKLQAKIPNRHSGDCHWWTYKVCDCGYLMRANSHDFGEPTGDTIEQFLEHSRRIQEFEQLQAKLERYEKALDVIAYKANELGLRQVARETLKAGDK